MKICLQIPKNKKYILACSFGPDSMALLDAALKENLDVYFVDENKEVFDTMMKDYTGGKHKTFESTDQTDFVKYNDYKNSFLDRFKK